MNKRVIAIAIVVGLSLTALILGGGLAQMITRSGITNTAQPSTNTTNVLQNASGSFSMGINVIPATRLVPLGGSADFTVQLLNGGDVTGYYSLSAIGPSGLSFEFSPASVTTSGCVRCAADLRVQSSGAMDAGAYQVTIEATGPKGLVNQTFDFRVQQNLVLLSSTNLNQFTNLTLKVGDTVTWAALDGPFGDVSNGWHQVNFFNSTVTSGWILDPEHGGQQWSYTFKQPGVYRYYDNAFPTITGEVVVLP